MAEGQAAAGQDETGPAGGDGQGHSGRDQGAASPRAELGVLPGQEVATGVSVPGVGGKVQLGIQPEQLDVDR